MDFLAHLPNLKLLDLMYCPVDSIPTELFLGLSELRHLDISFTKLCDLPDMEPLEKLDHLNCGDTSIILSSDFRFPPNLSFLSLSRTPNHRIPNGLRYLTSLRKLHLSGLVLDELPNWLPEFASHFDVGQTYLGSIRLDRCTITMIDTTIDGVDMSIFARPYHLVVEWFEKRMRGESHSLNEIKVVFLGDGKAGKSHTIARLMTNGGAPVGYVDVRTPGIVIKDIDYRVAGRDATLHLWDFGGQDILHSMHRIFLTERTIYVVLVDGSSGNQDERARYWLDNIQSFAKDSPVILVLNKLDDDLQADVNAVELKSKFQGLKQIIKLSALQYSQKRFNRDFRDVLLNEIAKTKYLDTQWPDNWIRVKRELEQKNVSYIRGGDYLDICKKCNMDDNQKSLLQWFHDLGVSFCCCNGGNEALEDYVVLNPNWITNALYIILYNKREGGKGGLIPVRTIREMLGRKALSNRAIRRVIPDACYEGYDVNYVLDVFHAFRLSFRQDDNHEFFPMLADINAKDIAMEYAGLSSSLEFNMNFNYLPNNLLHQLMVERSSELDMTNVWRTGARFHIEELGYSAVVVIDSNTLRFFIRHTDPMHRPNTYLTILKASVDRIVAKMGLKPPDNRLVYKLDSKREEFEFDLLKEMLDAGETSIYSRIQRKRIPITDILNQSAPDGLEDEMKLLNAIQRSCQNIQGEPDYYLKGDGHGMEDKRNRRIRDDLFGWGYNIQDQTQRGLSGSGTSIGELDFLLHNEKREPWTAIEALRVSDGKMAEWKNI